MIRAMASSSSVAAATVTLLPVVAAPSGLALGGGFEVLVHCDALQTHANITLGLVETLVGLVPSGGGCKQLLHRWCADAEGIDDVQNAALTTFNLIGKARTAASPEEARPLRLMRAHDAVSMNRDRLLGDGKALALELADNYSAPQSPKFIALGQAGRTAMASVLQELVDQGVAKAHDVVVSRQLARVLSGGDAARGDALSEQDLLDLERAAFIELAHTDETRARIEHMLKSGRPLRN